MARSPAGPFWETGLRGNKLLPPILAAALATLAVFLYLPPLASVMAFAPLSARQIAIAVGLALVCTMPLELTKLGPVAEEAGQE